MTLLSICQDVADEIGIARPTTIAGSTNADETKLFRLANKVGYDLSTAFTWQDLCKEHTFSAISGEEQTGILPDDFSRFVPNTFWDRSGIKLITGPINPVQWQSLKANTRYLVERKFIYRGDSIFIYPVMAGNEDLAFEYSSNEWVRSAGDDAQTKFESDTDTSLIDEELLTLGVLFQLLESDGLPSGLANKQFQDRFDMLVGNESDNDAILSTGDIFGQGRGWLGSPAVRGSLQGWYNQ